MDMTRTKTVLSAAILCCALVACDTAAEKEAKYLTRGMTLLEQGDFDKARVEFKNAGKINPTDPDVRYRLGLADEAQGDLRGAFGNFLLAEQQNARFRPTLLKLTQFFMSGGAYEEADKRLAIVLEDEPGSVDGIALKAALLLRREDYVATEIEARRALQLDPQNIAAISVLCGMYIALDQGEKAEEVVNGGLALSHDNLALLHLKIAMYKKLQNDAKVEATYKHVLALRPGDRTSRLELIQLYQGQNRIDDAEAVLRDGVAVAPLDWDMKKVLVAFLNEYRGLEVAETEVRGYMAKSPDKPDLVFWLVELYIKTNAVDRAVALLQQVIAKDGDGPVGLQARNALAGISLHQGQRPLAERLIGEVLEKSPGNRPALYMRASFSFEDGHYQGAVTDLRAILGESARDVNALRLLAEALLRQNYLDLAIDAGNQLVEADPADIAARVRLAQMYQMSGSPQRALDILASAVKVSPNDPAIWDTEAQIQISTNDNKGAEASIITLQALPGQQLAAAFLSGQLLSQSGQSESAIKQYSIVVLADPKAPLGEHALAALVDVDGRLHKLDDAALLIEGLKDQTPFIATTLGEVYWGLGKQDAAASQFDKAIAMDAPPRPQPYLDRARLYLSQQKPEQAAEVLSRGMAALPRDIDIPNMLAEVDETLGHYPQAVSLYEALLDSHPGLDVVANNMAQLIADYQNNDLQARDRALKVAERFQGATNPLLLDTLSWVYFRQEKLPQALVLAERVLTYPNLPAQVHYHLGAILLSANRKDEARGQLELAVADGGSYAGSDEAKRLLKSIPL